MSFLDQTSLVLHVLAAAGLVSGATVQIFAGNRLRIADTAEAIARWARFARSAGPLLIGSAVVSFVTGSHMAGSVWTTESVSGFSHPFITLGAAALVLLAPIGAMIGGPRLRRLANDADAGEETAALQERARSAGLWGPIYSLLGVSIGLIWVMSAKPSWAVTALILVGTFGVGWAVGVADARRSVR